MWSHFGSSRREVPSADARILLAAQGSPRSVVNRAYYAMFYSVLALLANSGLGAPKHAGVIALFDRHFVKTGVFPTNMSRAIHKAFELRQIEDYREFSACDEIRANQVLESASCFVEAVENYLAKKG